MKANVVQILVSIVVYLIAMLGIGFFFAKRSGKGASSYYLGGRSLGPLVTAMSAEASDMSGWLLMGLPGLALLCGVAEASWTAIGLAIGTYLNWLFVAKRLRRYSQAAGDAITIPQFFSNRFADKRNILKTVAAGIIIIFFVPYTASGFMTCGKLFSTLFGMDYHLAMGIAAAVIILYTVIGGFLAASVTDLVQTIVMTVSLLAVIGFGVASAGGFGAVFENAKAIPNFFDLTGVAGQGSGSFGALSIVTTLAWGLGYFGMPHVLLRFMAIKDGRQIKTSRRIATSWVVISMAAAIFIGVVGNRLMQMGILPQYASTAESETVIVDMAKLISNNGVLLALLAGVILAGVMAATMSTSDSQLLTAASAVSEDLLRGTCRLKIGEKASVWIARGTVILVSIVGVALAWNPNNSVFKVVSFAWAGFGATFGPLMLFSLFWKRTTLPAAIAGLITGGVTIFVWKYLVAPNVSFLNVYELLPAFILSSLVIVIVSLCTKKPSQSILDTFQAAKNG